MKTKPRLWLRGDARLWYSPLQQDVRVLSFDARPRVEYKPAVTCIGPRCIFCLIQNKDFRVRSARWFSKRRTPLGV